MMCFPVWLIGVLCGFGIALVGFLTGRMLYFSSFGLIVVAFCCFGFGCVWFGLVFLRRRLCVGLLRYGFCVGFAACRFGWVLASASGFHAGLLVGWMWCSCGLVLCF